MALLPMNLESDQLPSAQESMFEETADFAALESYEPAEDPSYADRSYETAEEFHEDGPEPIAGSAPEIPLAGIGDVNEDFQAPIDPGAAHPGAQSSATPEAPAQSLPLAQLPPAALTVDDFTALEERILRAVTLVRSERQARATAEERAAALEFSIQTRFEIQAQEQAAAIERLEQEVLALRKEREQVRQRVERLLGQLDALEI